MKSTRCSRISRSGGESRHASVRRGTADACYRAHPAHRRELLLLDEISEGLAPVIVQTLGRVIRMLKERGYTIIIVEQNFRFAAPLADRHYVIEHGRVVETVTMAELDQDG